MHTEEILHKITKPFILAGIYKDEKSDLNEQNKQNDLNEPNLTGMRPQIFTQCFDTFRNLGYFHPYTQLNIKTSIK